MNNLNNDILEKIENYSKLKLNEDEKKAFSEDFNNFMNLLSKLEKL